MYTKNRESSLEQEVSNYVNERLWVYQLKERLGNGLKNLVEKLQYHGNNVNN